MFSAFFSQALELIGKAFLLAAFFPTLVVAVGVALSVDAEGSLAVVGAWAEQDDFSSQATSALLLLAGVYLTAYVVYGLREALTWVLRTGWPWLAPLRPGRKNRFIQKRRDLDDSKRLSLAVPNATVWAETGFGPTEQEDNPYRGKLLSDRRLNRERKRVRSGLRHLERRRSRFAQLDPLPLKWERKIERLLVGLHLLSFYDDFGEGTELRRLIERTTRLDGCDGSRLAAWCRSIQRRTWGDISDAHSADFHFPPEKFIQPTALGNVLSWIATYPAERYGINLDVVYPRLQKCIDADFGRLVEDRKTFFDFSVVFAGLCYLAAAGFLIYGLSSAAYALTTGDPIESELLGVLERLRAPVLLAAGWGLASTIFYFVAVAGAKAYGLTVHSSIDLYRLKLLEALSVKAPRSLETEKNIWQELTASFIGYRVPDVALATAEPEPIVTPPEPPRRSWIRVLTGRFRERRDGG